MSEAELQEQVRTACKQLGLFHFHVLNSVGCEPGWPDSVIIGPRKCIYRELKSEYGRPTPDQTRVGYLLKAAGQSWRIWRPSDWYGGLIAAELAEVAAVQTELFGRTDPGPCYGTACDHVSHRSA
jgi:hypothetical protein